MTIKDEETCTLFCIGVWHLKSCFPIAVIGWEMCKKKNKTVHWFPCCLLFFFREFMQCVFSLLFGGFDIVEQKEFFFFF